MSLLRRRNALSTWELHYGPNMTPMVDVVMVILVFFMASTSILGPEWFLRAALPRARANPQVDPAKEPVRIRVEVKRAGPVAAIVIDGAAPVPVSEVESRLTERQKAANGAEIIVLVAPDTAAPYEAVVHVHEVCYRLGITKVGLIDTTTK